MPFRRTSSLQFLFLAIVCLISQQPTLSLIPEKIVPPKQQKHQAASPAPSRRDIFRTLTSAAMAQTIVLGGNVKHNNPANALKPNNEALCGTGFFTNIAQYKCTDIGDISDEGKSRKTTKEEESRLDSLMGKLDLSGGSSDEEESSSSNEKSGYEKSDGATK